MGRASRRILIAGVCIFNLGIACIYLWPLRGRPVWDLPQFYFAGKLVRQGRISELYNRAAYEPLIAELRTTDPQATRYSLYFNRPAFEAPLFLPLAFFSFRQA